jgi:hypothetical protein
MHKPQCFDPKRSAVPLPIPPGLASRGSLLT